MYKLLALFLVVSCRTSEAVVALGGAAIVSGNRVVHFDSDRGGYQDKWFAQDKLLHASLAYVITDACGTLGGRRPVCASIVGLGGVGWEFSQGYVSNRDIIANLLGAAFNTALHWRH